MLPFGRRTKNISGGSVLPFLHEFDRGLAKQFIGEKVDLSHGVGQPYGQLLTQEHEGRFLTCIVPA